MTQVNWNSVLEKGPRNSDGAFTIDNRSAHLNNIITRANIENALSVVSVLTASEVELPESTIFSEDEVINKICEVVGFSPDDFDVISSVHYIEPKGPLISLVAETHEVPDGFEKAEIHFISRHRKLPEGFQQDTSDIFMLGYSPLLLELSELYQDQIKDAKANPEKFPNGLKFGELKDNEFYNFEIDKVITYVPLAEYTEEGWHIFK